MLILHFAFLSTSAPADDALFFFIPFSPKMFLRIWDNDDSWFEDCFKRPKSFKELAKFVFIDSLLIPLFLCIWTGLSVLDLIFQNTRECCGSRKSHYLRDRHTKRNMRKEYLKPLPRRKRALTIPLPHPLLPFSFKQLTQDQSPSPILTKLPYELRQLVYERVIYYEGRGRVFHVFRKWYKMNSWQCTKAVDSLPCYWSIPCSPALPLNSIYSFPDGRQYNADHLKGAVRCDGGIISLMQTCRQIYTESIPLLYSAHFHFPDALDIFGFSRSVIPRRLDSIRTISLDWDNSHTLLRARTSGFRSVAQQQYLWQKTWEVLSVMKGLRELRIYAKIFRVQNNLCGLYGARDLMRKIKGLKVFELIVPTSQLPLWSGFVQAGMEIRLVGQSDGPEE